MIMTAPGWTLTRRLYEQGYNKRDVQLLFRFIDWLMALPPELKRQFERTITEYEEAQKMTFITSIEEIGIEKGIQQGREQGILQKARKVVIEVLKIRFENVPETLVEAINTFDDADILKTLHKQAVIVESIEQFTQDMDNLLADKSDQDQALS